MTDAVAAYPGAPVAQAGMTKRGPGMVVVLGLVTFGIYAWYWAIKTKTDLNRNGAEKIPTAWIWLIPVVGGLYWWWKYAKGAEKVTNGGVSAVALFVLTLFVAPVGWYLAQSAYNKV